MIDKPLICLGSAVWDTIFQVDVLPASGIKVLPSRAVQVASGMATSAAITIARLGGSVQLWSRVGDDDIGRKFIQDVRREGVETDFVQMQPGVPTPFSTVVVDASGERMVVPFFDPRMLVDPSWLPLERVATAGAVMADMRWVEGATALFHIARAHGVPTILDADTAPLGDLRLLVSMASHVLFSEVALSSYVAGATPEQALARVAAEAKADVLGVTLGGEGALIWTREDGELRHYPAPKIKPVDTLNAGDVWHGTFAWGLTNGWPIDRIVPAANLAAAMKCEVFGGPAGAPTYDELRARARLAGFEL